MATCEMCGKDTELFLAEIEGTEIKVCASCARYGKVKRKIYPMAPAAVRKRVVPKEPDKEIIQSVREDFPQLIKGKREEMGLKQIELAKKLNERESLLQKIESGSITPSLELARKLEKYLGLTLVEQKEVTKEKLKSKSYNLTIGDMIKFKQD